MRVSFLALLCLLICAQVEGKTPRSAKSPSPRAEIDLRKISARLRVKKGLRVNFVQNVLTIRKKIRKTEGIGLFHPDGRFRWTVTHLGELARVFVYDNRTITEYLPDEKTANVWDISNHDIGRVVAMIRSLDELLRNYTVQEKKKSQHMLNLTLLPKTGDADIDRVLLEINLQKNFINTIKIIYTHKRYREYVFQNPIRKTIAPHHFKFVAPKGVKVNRIR